MRKFKHKKTGHIFEQDGSYYNRPKYEHIPAWLVEDSNDWEEIIEKDYEILSLNIHDSRLSDVTGYGNEYIEALLKDRLNKIHSVKRLSDGEIFTIGDNVIFSAKSGSVLKGPIIQFRIDTEFGIIVDYRDNSKCVGQHWNYLNNAEKSKKPLFTTEDGVDIFEGESYYELITPDFHNKPCIWNILPTKTRGNINYDQNYNKQHGRIWFSTEEKAQEYIDLHKPKYSINDLNNASKIVNTQIFKGYVSIEMILFNLGIELKKLNK